MARRGAAAEAEARGRSLGGGGGSCAALGRPCPTVTSLPAPAAPSAGCRPPGRQDGSSGESCYCLFIITYIILDHVYMYMFVITCARLDESRAV